MANPLHDVQKYGQSIWYDNIRRGLITSGELARMVEGDGLLGVTSNPAIFEKAIAGSADYDQALKALVSKGVETAQDLYERLAVQDIQLAADVLYPVHIRTRGRDGYVSFEAQPGSSAAMIAEARRMFAAVGRPNVYIKIPGVPEGPEAVEELIFQGININITLLFEVEVYQRFAEAYIRGIERRVEAGLPVDHIHSVERAREVGSIHRILPPHELRPYLIDAVERGMEKELARLGVLPARLVETAT